ncbi:putative dTDP-4-dehydrorhamnose reductase [Ruminococcaceae bacterium BL-4]|jgi:dTDP-4-dehydrorhamnose reductase|nr:putative dTDP-4-dehydrorhamnose reductase [Ruminococcaceae bacterium BL-4]
MKVLVTGVKGQLGYDVMKVLKSRKIDCIGADLEQFDITDLEATEKFIKEYHPDTVIHCSAFTAVDRAEEQLDLCRKVNAEGPRNIAKVCKELDAKMVYISTDYVFPGVGDHVYEPDDPTGPLSVYGETKLEGEKAVQALLNRYFIVRISWVFGKNGNNFIKTMLRLSETHDEVSVVCDQIGSPTYTADLAPLLCDMVETEKYGIYHATNEGYCSWADFAKEIFRQSGRSTKVNAIPSDQYPAKAHRPENSRMSKDKLVENGFHRLPTWQDALNRYLTEINEKA